MPMPTHDEMAERGRKICNCKQCAEPKKHPCSRALWAASIALKLIEEREGNRLMPTPTTPELDKHLWGDCLVLATNSVKLVLQLDRAKAIYDYIRARDGHWPAKGAD